MNELYRITTGGHGYQSLVQHTVNSYYDKGVYAPAQPRYRLGVLETLTVDGPLTRDEIVKRISEGLIDRERETMWPLRAIQLREAVARQFEWLLTNGYIEEVH